MSIKSLLAIQNPEDEGLGYYTVQPYEDDPNSPFGPNAAVIRANQELSAQNKSLIDAASSVPPTVVTQSPEEMIAVARKYEFLRGTRPGFDYGVGSNYRNAFFNRDSGLGLDIFATVVQSVVKSAPQAFKGVKLPGAVSAEQAGLSLPSWLPKISVPKPIQDAVKKVATTAKEDLAKKKAAEDAARAAGGVAEQTSGSPNPPTNSMSPWVLGGAAVLLIGGAAWFLRRRK